MYKGTNILVGGRYAKILLSMATGKGQFCLLASLLVLVAIVAADFEASGGECGCPASAVSCHMAGQREHVCSSRAEVVESEHRFGEVFTELVDEGLQDPSKGSVVPPTKKMDNAKGLSSYHGKEWWKKNNNQRSPFQDSRDEASGAAPGGDKEAAHPLSQGNDKAPQEIGKAPKDSSWEKQEKELDGKEVKKKEKAYADEDKEKEAKRFDARKDQIRGDQRRAKQKKLSKSGGGLKDQGASSSMVDDTQHVAWKKPGATTDFSTAYTVTHRKIQDSPDFRPGYSYVQGGECGCPDSYEKCEYRSTMDIKTLCSIPGGMSLSNAETRITFSARHTDEGSEPGDSPKELERLFEQAIPFRTPCEKKLVEWSDVRASSTCRASSPAHLVFKYTVEIVTTNRRLWKFRFGLDAGKGAGVILDGRMVVGSFLGRNTWWGRNWGDSSVITTDWLTLDRGAHKIDVIAFDDCCDGQTSGQFKIQGDDWKSISNSELDNSRVK